MTAESVIFAHTWEALVFACVLSAVPLAVSLAVGLACSVFQAATQIQEQTLTFVPKLLAVILVLYFAAPPLSEQFVHYCARAIDDLPLIANGRR